MKLAIIGSGYVGLTTGACFANLGNDVTCVDIDKSKIKLLKKGKIPFFEPGLAEMVSLNIKEQRLSFTTDAAKAVQGSDVVFIAVGTPTKENGDGEADLSGVYTVAGNIGRSLNGYKVIVTKSTVPVGTADKVKGIISKNLPAKTDFDVASNPEFLREGEAIQDFMVPDRIVVGADSQRARETLQDLYRPLERAGRPLVVTDIKSAELIKYASNAMLATRISFMNELACLCEKVGADIKTIARGMGLDSRIGSRFLHAGIGYGGSCFPKDVKALASTMKARGCSSHILDSVTKVNEAQKMSLLPKIQKLVPDIRGKQIALWGLAFKPKTDDMREAPSLVVISQLLEKGAKINAFDPAAMEAARKIAKDISYSDNMYNSVKGAELLVIVTEWDEFRTPDFRRIKKLMASPNIVDGRNIYEPEEMKELGFNYIGVGR